MNMRLGEALRTGMSAPLFITLASAHCVRRASNSGVKAFSILFNKITIPGIGTEDV